MDFNDLKPEHLTAIRKFVSSDEFLEIKDAFIAHTPEGGAEGRPGESDAKNLGKLLGTRYVFNKLETLARKTNKPDNGKTITRGRVDSGVDPDLET